MSAGASAGQKAAALRAQAVPRGLKRRFLALLGMDRQGARLAAEARCWEAGVVGEQWTTAMLAPLRAEGWVCFDDRRIPGLGRANADHVVVAPSGRVFLVDSKMWNARGRARGLVRVVRGRLVHGDVDKDRQIKTVLAEAECVGRALGAAVTPLIVVHTAPVDGGGFVLRGVPVVPAGRLVELLRGNTGRPDPAAARRMALRANVKLPRYVE
ncbi:nuclease-related domain-containing protein [Streptomyces himastatinicus]|uniref:nuclease-related domain-containing protein n=1 Tax=Streptomyces himastatinicus TaxID=998084 RepID=UPI0001B4FC4D|nr:nuclease-related domain-containing protein [Streptomyces himastatinicus]